MAQNSSLKLACKNTCSRCFISFFHGAIWPRGLIPSWSHPPFGGGLRQNEAHMIQIRDLSKPQMQLADLQIENPYSVCSAFQWSSFVQAWPGIRPGSWIRACTPPPLLHLLGQLPKLNAQRILGQLPHSPHNISANCAKMLELLCGACFCGDCHLVDDAEGDLGKSSRISPTFWFLTTRSVL